MYYVLIYESNGIQNVPQLTLLEHFIDAVAIVESERDFNASLSPKGRQNSTVKPLMQVFRIISCKAIAKALTITGRTASFKINRTKAFSLLFHL
jgi:hypothetical protein